MHDLLYSVAAIAVIAAVTWLLRALPFLLFGGGRPLPKAVRYLAHVLPPAIMTVLVFYCLRGTDFSPLSSSLPPLAASAAVVLLQIWRKNMYLSILAGTVLYMILIRLV
ncbi:MAG: AzlD domain-containing protein [Oscillibacter sp.]|nr:AzlD domain-containing protein [Oscillibacter sp.]